MREGRRRSGPAVMGRLIGLVKPLLPLMCLAILLGVAGYLCAIFLTILAGQALFRGLMEMMGISLMPGMTGGFASMGFTSLFFLLILLAVLRGVLHYGEQYCNHFIAFKLLAVIRHKVFAALRRLCPAKLEGRDKGNLIAVLTSDIELLEVFYAHTISPIVIAVLTSGIMILYIGRNSAAAGILALAGYLAVGAAVPLLVGRAGGQEGLWMRNSFGDLNSFILDSLRGLDETIQYRGGAKRLQEMEERSRRLGKMQRKLNRLEASQRSVTNLLILLFSFAMLILMLYFYRKGGVDYRQMLTAVIAMMGSFGPVVALSNLSNNLNQTLASGERVLSLLEETPKVEEIEGKEPAVFGDVAMEQVDFAYEKEQILKNCSLTVPQGKILGIHGVSGSGKSTILKLLMRFWDIQGGSIRIGSREISGINTADLRDMESYVTQETCLFHDTIAENIAVGKPDASREEIIAAAKKASIHDFITGLPKGYDTPVGELGDTLSGGERQRIGIARSFLHDSPLLLLDEPTSNLDALNEGVILKALAKTRGEKTVVLVSHRDSTMNAADLVYEMRKQ